jgi:hypothetical protein
MDKDGLDIYFLNRATVRNVTSSFQLQGVFQQPSVFKGTRAHMP